MPSDYQAYVYEAEILAEYDAMSKQIGTIAEMARIRKSLHSYTDDIIETDAGMS